MNVTVKELNAKFDEEGFLLLKHAGRWVQACCPESALKEFALGNPQCGDWCPRLVEGTKDKDGSPCVAATCGTFPRAFNLVEDLRKPAESEQV